MGINVLRVELAREIGNLKTYKITYQEETEVETEVVLVGESIGVEPNLPEAVLDFAEQ